MTCTYQIPSGPNRGKIIEMKWLDGSSVEHWMAGSMVLNTDTGIVTDPAKPKDVARATQEQADKIENGDV